MGISEREKLVLNAIVDYYLTVGDTIGSRTLVKKYGTKRKNRKNGKNSF